MGGQKIKQEIKENWVNEKLTNHRLDEIWLAAEEVVKKDLLLKLYKYANSKKKYSLDMREVEKQFKESSK